LSIQDSDSFYYARIVIKSAYKSNPPKSEEKLPEYQKTKIDNLLLYCFASKLFQMAKQIILLLLIITSLDLMAQQRVGINTSTPSRTLHVNGTSNQFLRVQSSTAFGGLTGLELVRGTNDLLSKDWKLINDASFKILNSDDNFATAGNE
jgi:hypothetical protein